MLSVDDSACTEFKDYSSSYTNTSWDIDDENGK